MHFTLALMALALEALAGYPQFLYRRVGHPVSWMGRLIARCERAWNSPHLTFAQRRTRGILTLVLCLTVVVAASIACVTGLDIATTPPIDLILAAILASTLVAQRSLYQHVAAVAVALEQHGIEAARISVSMIVGRDPAALDEHAVSRAAIESLSENFSDGIVAPVFWLTLGGLPGIAAYKLINTADSMIGHKSDRYLAFGWAAARLDDLVNLPASRLSALWIILASNLVSGASANASLRAVLRDASRHRSPNAGWPESAMAGALGLRLAGPRVYAGITVDDHWMGEGRAEATASDIRRALRIYCVSCGIQAAVIAVLAFALRG